jgi:hypothetical protein
LLLCFLLSLGMAFGPASLAQAQERTGTIEGEVTDASGGVLPGVTVTFTNKQSNRPTSVVTDGAGRYRAELEPGSYTARFELAGFARQEMAAVEVLLGRTFTVNAGLKVGNVSEAVQVTAENAPLIDLSTATVSHNVTSAELDRMPKARTFQGVALTAPGVNQGEIEGGIQVHGASGAENAYTVDGVVTNSLLYGSSRQDTVFEYLQEVQVKTTGINAEFGGALGGVISAVTKSGGNTFTGELHHYFSGSPMSAGPVQRLNLDPTDDTTVRNVQEPKQDLFRNEVGGSVGGPIIRDRLFFFGSYSPRFVRRTNEYLFSSGTDPGEIKQEQTLTQAFGKITYGGSGRLQVGGSFLATPVRSKGTPIAYSGTIPLSVVSSKAANVVNLERGFEIDQTNTSGFADITMGRSGMLSVRGGMFHDNYKDTGVPTTTSYTYQRSAVGVPGVPAELQQPIGYFNTPRTQIALKDTTKRNFINADYLHTFSGGGMHALKAGVGYQRTNNDVDTAYPGGYVYIYWNNAAPNFNNTATGRGTYGYYRVDDIGTFGNVTGDLVSLYVQDSWNVTDRLTVNLGLRAENERVPTFSPDVRKYAFEFGFADKIAPRVAFAYDVRGDGRVKVAGSWGRYFDWTKYELSRGSFIGDVGGQRWGDRWKIYYRALDTLDIANLSLNNMPGRDLWGSPTGFRDLRLSHIEDIDPNVQPMFQDSLNASVEFQTGPRTVVGIHFVHNNLGRTIEDFGALVDGDSVYKIGNPGEGLAAMAAPSFSTYGEFPMPKPKRQYDAMELTLNRRFGNNWFAGASYTLSRLYGNYSGLANSDEISTPTTGVSSATAQQSAGSIARPGSNAHIGWDTDITLWDAAGNLDPRGRLATDRPHVVKLYGSYVMPFGTTIGGFFYGGSGTPITTVVNEANTFYAPMVNGRGDLGRTPVLTRTDLLVSHEFAMAGARRLRLEANFLNLFNQKTATHIFNFRNKGAPGGGSTLPAAAIDLSESDITKGYDYEALIRASQLGNNAFDPRYGREDLWTPGLQGQFAVKFLF